MSKTKLIVTEGGRDRVHELFDERTVIGRGAHADLVLRSPRAGEQHCEIIATDSGYRLIDLETLEGTHVNGRPVNQHPLANGDTIEIGDAKITYIGQSAPPPKASPKPAIPPLTELPTDESGKPRRFYRDESRSAREQNWIPMVVIGSIVVLLGVLIAALASNTPGEEDRTRFARAKNLAGSDDAVQLEKALSILDSIEKGTVDERAMNALATDIRYRLSELELEERNRKAQAFHDQIVEQLASFPSDERKASFLRGRIDAFRREFPKHGLADELEKRLDELTGGHLTGEEALGHDRWWTRRRIKITDAIHLQDYIEAFELLSSAEAHPVRGPALADKIATQREILERAYGRFFEEQKEDALDAQAAGRQREARVILERLAKIPIEPYQGQAKRFLSKLE